MKKIVPLFILILSFIACDQINSPVQIEATNNIVRSISVTVAQTNGTPTSISKTVTVKLADYISNIGDLTGVDISNISYQFKNFSGNTNGVVQTMTLKAEGVVLETQNNVNVSQEATNQTVFQVTDASVISQLETILLNNTEATLEASGTVLTDAGTMAFDLEVTIDMTATLN